MKTYEIFQIHQGAVIANSTDPEMLNWLETEVKKVAPASKVTRGKWNIEVKNLDHRDSEFAWWIISKICHLGWEPFAVISRGEYNIMGNIYFRKEKNSE